MKPPRKGPVAPRRSLPLVEATALAPPPGWADRLGALGVRLTEPQIAQLGDYLGRLLATNAVMNLTAITTPDEAWERHALDALTLVPLLADVPAGAKVVDVGTGGGVPGLPLAIARPDLAITLVEATQKKCAFLSATSAALGLRNVAVLAQRAEDVVRSRPRTYDVATARAVAALETLIPWTMPLVKPGGLGVFIKGAKADEELSAAQLVLARHRCAHERTVVTPTGRVVVLRAAKDFGV